MAKLKPDYINWVLTLNATQAQEEFHKLEKDNKELQKQTNNHRKALAQLVATGKEGTEEYKNLEKKIKENTQTMAQNSAKMNEVAKRFDLTSMSVNQLKKRLKDLQREFNSTSKATEPKRYNELRSEITRVQVALDKANSSARGLGGAFFSLNKMKETVKGFFFQIGATILTLVTGSFKNAFNLIVDFEKANSKLAGILGTTKEGIRELEAGARQLGATTAYSAAQVTGLQIELAKLGFSKEQILQMEGAVLKFAKAVDTDLSSASAFAGAALRIFNKDASETEDVLATFAVATTKTALDFSKLEASLSTVGPVANSFGLSIEDTTALLGMLANAGFDASSAATATRNIILNLCDANGDLAKALGGPVHNAADLAEGLKKLNAEGVDLAKALELTDKRSVAAFSTFLNQADNITALRDSITGVTADFNQMSATMSDNVAGAMAGLKSAAEELVLKISSGTTGPIKDLINGLTSIVRVTGDLIVWMGKFSGIIKTAFIVLVSYKAAVIATRIVVNLLTKSHDLLSNVFSVCSKAGKGLAAMFGTLRNGITATTFTVKGLRAALNSIPWMAVINLVLTAVSSFLLLRKRTEETLTAAKALKEAEKSATEEYAKQRSNLESLILVAKNENVSLVRRRKAIEQLNKIIPGYNARIDATTKKYKASKEAIDKYLDSLQKEMRYKANQEALAKLVKTAEEKRRVKDETEIEQVEVIKQKRTEQANIGKSGPKPTSYAGKLGKSTANFGKNQRLEREIIEAGEKRAKTRKEWQDSEAEVKKMESWIEKGLNSKHLIAPETSDNIETEITTPVKNAGAAVDATIEKIKNLKAELKALRKEEPQSKADLKRIEDRKAEIRRDIKFLEGKVPKGKHTPGTYGEDSLDEATAAADDLHQKKLLDINLLKGSISEADFAIKKNEELIRYCGDLETALASLREKTDKTHTATLDKITAEENKIGQQVLAAQQAINKATAQKEQEGLDQRLAAHQAYYDTQEQTVKRELMNQQKTEGEAEVYLLAQKKAMHEAQLKELEDFKTKTENADYLGAEEKRKLLEKISADIRSMQSNVLTDTGKFSEKYRELVTDSTSAEGIKNTFDLQRRNIEATYAVMIKTVGEGSDQAVALEEEKQRRIAALNYQYMEQQWQLKELTGLSWADEYDRELAQLENYHRQGLVKEKDYQRKKLQLGVNNAKKYFDYYAQLSGSMFTAIQDAEIARSDAKYDVLIQQAKNNGEDTAALEEEKENKKLEIQKKYADVNFAIKVSQIIADTAVSIMKAFADLGPIGGAIAAAMLTATGVAQVVSAKAERDKIKNMQPGNTAGTTQTAPAKAERVLSGYSEGGYTGDGGRYEVAGVVHRGEYVVPMPIMNNPRVVDAVGTIEAIRRNKIYSAGLPAGIPSAGYADGGYTSAVPLADVTELSAAARELREAVGNIRAYVVLKDIEKAQSSLDRARAPFTRNR